MTGKKSVHINDSIIIDDISSFDEWRNELAKIQARQCFKAFQF